MEPLFAERVYFMRFSPPGIAGGATNAYSTITFPKYNRGVQATTIER